ncbi:MULTISPECIES: cobalamin biosynthesis protein [unclassified Pseudomonas]|uniref:cobalamin biosynthesis protein n=1 Tax=unclassified Pseudomonas TaxID=196821 RepID=UPI00244A993B|nr:MULTISPECIES: cobalamin biosynthesis protein [unclassified Pseudomonas]MDH0301809.1 cobalamin biosynthesis protein [Pseudomonas sp. GD04091]MDH1983903.1 cobalamin biosynthesis protein [Pseudomonas sp. GD03689]
MPVHPPVLYAGFGCRRGCPVETLAVLLRQTLASHDLPLSALQAIASIAPKAREPGLLALAERLGVPFMCFDAGHLLTFEPLLSLRSASAYAQTGCWGVAESTALALAAHASGQPRLHVPRQVLGGATLALAIGE